MLLNIDSRPLLRALHASSCGEQRHLVSDARRQPEQFSSWLNTNHMAHQTTTEFLILAWMLSACEAVKGSSSPFQIKQFTVKVKLHKV